MRLFLALLALPLFAQPVVSNVRIGDQTHSTIQLAWDSDVTPDLQRAIIGPAGVSIVVSGGTATATFPVAHRILSATASPFVYVFNSATSALNTGVAGVACTYSSPTVITWTTGAGNGTYTDANVYTWMENGIDGVGAWPTAINQNIALSGFNPGVQWDICVESHATTWSGCPAGVNLRTTFPAAPAIDPAPPIAPTTFAYDYPSVAGAVTRNMTAACASWDADWAAAGISRRTTPVIISVPSTNTCTGTYVIPTDADSIQIDASLLDFTTNVISTKAAAAHGLTVNDPVKFGIDISNAYYLPSSLIPGIVYYVKTTPSASTFTVSATLGGATLPLLPYVFTADASTDYIRIDGSQNASVFVNGVLSSGNGGPVRVVSTGTLPAPLAAATVYYGVQCENPGNSFTGRCKLSLTAGGAAIDITTAGTGVHSIGGTGNTYPSFLKQIASPNWIILRTNATDAQLPPDHVQINGPAYAAKLPKFVAANSANNQTRPLTFGTLNHHIYIEGLEFTQAATAATDGNPVDPPAPPGFFTMNQSNDHIAWSRNYFHGLGCPDRMWHSNQIEGSYIAFDSNWFTGIETCRPAHTGLLMTYSTTTATFASGTVGMPNAVCTFAGTTFTKGTTVDGHVYFSMLNDCTLRATVPTGMTGSCSPIACTVTANATDNYPRASGRITEVPLGQVATVGGVFTAVGLVYDGTPQNWMAELQTDAQNVLITTLGPGPIAFTNNYLYNMSGIGWHISDDGGGLLIPSDLDISRNQWILTPDHIYGQTGSSGRRYIVRNQLEVKVGQRIRVKGNLFEGQFQGMTASGCALQIPSANATFTIPPAQNITGDILIQSNTVRNAECAFFGTGGAAGGRQPKVARRIEYSNNLAYNMQGWTQSEIYSVKWPDPQGYAFTWGYGGEDLVLKHNTFYDSRGAFGSFGFMQPRKLHGFSATDNIFFFGDDNTAFSANHGLSSGGLSGDQPTCWIAAAPNVSAEGMLKCSFTPTYTFAGNVLIAGYNNTQAQTGDTNAATYASTYYPSTNILLIPQQSTVAARVPAVKFYLSPIPADGYKATAVSHNLRLRYDSPYISGGHLSTDGGNAGADVDTAEDDQGIIKNVRALSISASGATINFHAPDSGTNCYVGHGSGTDPTAWTTTAANTTASKERAVALTGLPGATLRYYQAWCSGAAPTATSSLTTQ